MSRRIDTILKSMLYHVKTAATLDEAIIALENMCDEKMVAYVEKKVEQAKKAKVKTKE